MMMHCELPERSMSARSVWYAYIPPWIGLHLAFPRYFHILSSVTIITMSLAPDWVKQLKPAEPHGTDLLTLERGRSSIQADKMALFLFGEEKLRRKNDVENILKNDPVFDKKKNYFDGRVDKFKTALARAKRMRQLAVKYGWDDMDMEIARKLISEPDPYGLHSRSVRDDLMHNKVPFADCRFALVVRFRHTVCSW